MGSETQNHYNAAAYITAYGDAIALKECLAAMRSQSYLLNKLPLLTICCDH
jgi:hypothetical protein